ncbi:MAG: hypothetical protein KJ065_28475, partial [Anaerolineae bacterium]|nr:hypothetical protein [Anaerolineae bacterium]
IQEQLTLRLALFVLKLGFGEGQLRHECGLWMRGHNYGKTGRFFRVSLGRPEPAAATTAHQENQRVALLR